MKKGMIITGTLIALASVATLKAQDTNTNSEFLQARPLELYPTKQCQTSGTDADPVFRGNELSIEGFGGGTLDEHDINHISGSRIRHDGRLGLGAGLEYFLVPYLGVEGEFYTENPDHSFVDEASGNLVLRVPIPIGSIGLAPYVFGGGGHQFDPFEDTFAQAGGGLELRLNPHIGLFADARAVFTENNGNHGLGRAGFRIAF
jgi:hypothetical protein